MFETYRMLGAERETELLREAERLQALPPGRLWSRVSRLLRGVGRAAARGEDVRLADRELSGTLSPLELAKPSAQDEAA